MDIYFAKTQGFCSGVAMAIEMVEKALEKYGTPIYVFHEIVHNTHVVNEFRRKGVVFVDSVEEVPAGSRLIFSAHGVSPETVEKANIGKLHTIDATCPLVKKVHKQASDLSGKGYHVVLIGHKKHQEIIGTSGHVAPSLLHIVETPADIERLDIPPNAPVACLTQTTLSVDDSRELIDRLKKRFPALVGSSRGGICYATQTRQDAVKELAKTVDVIIVCGSPSSSNSNRLRETGLRCGVPSYIIDAPGDLDLGLLKDKKRVGISSGASVPGEIVEQVVEVICRAFPGVRIHRWVASGKKTAFRLPAI